MLESTRSFEAVGALALLLLGVTTACATARPTAAPPRPAAAVTPGPSTPQELDLVVMARGDPESWPSQREGSWGGRLPEDAPGQLRDAVVAEARKLGAARVRAAPAPARPAPRPVQASRGSPWGDLVPAAASPDPGPAALPALAPLPPPGVIWLEITALQLEQASLSTGSTSAALTLTVKAVLTTGAAGPAIVTPVTLALIDPERRTAHAWATTGWGAEDGAPAKAAAARLLARAAARLAATLRSAGGAGQAPVAAGTPPSPSLEPGGAAPPADGAAHDAEPRGRIDVSAAYLAGEWTDLRLVPATGQGAAAGAWKGLGYGAKGGGIAAGVCGPLAFFCAVVLVPSGAAVGALFGAVGGAADPPMRGEAVARRAELPEPRLRSALGDALLRLARAPALAATIERAAKETLAEGAPPDQPAPEVRLSSLAARLTGVDGPLHPARLTLAVTGAVGAPAAGPISVEVGTPDPLPAELWAEDDGALLAAALQQSAAQAGRDLAAQARGRVAVPGAAP